MLNEQSRMEICNRSRLETEKRGDDFYGIRGYKRKMNCSRNANSLLLLSITRSSVSFSRKNGEKSIGGIHFFNEIYRDLNKQDNRKRERKRCTFPRCFSFFFYLSSRDNFTTLCMHFLFLSTHFLYFLYQANFQGNISI